MKFKESDVTRVKNLIIALKKAKFDDIVGMELMALAQVFTWVNWLAVEMEKEVNGPTLKSVPTENVPPVIEPPKGCVY